MGGYSTLLPIYSFTSSYYYMATVVCNIMYNATSGQRLTQRGTHLLAPDLSGVFGTRDGGPAQLFGHQGLLLLQSRISWNDP